MPSATTAPESTPSSSSSDLSSADTASSTSTSTSVTSFAAVTSLSASSSAASSSASSSSTFSRTIPPPPGFGNPSAPPAPSAGEHGEEREYKSTTLAALGTLFGIMAIIAAIWLTARCLLARRKRDEEQGLGGDGGGSDRSRPNKQGWGSRLTFTGNKEKFWQRLDEYHDSLKTRDEARARESALRRGHEGSVSGSSISRVPTFTHHASRSQTSFSGVGATVPPPPNKHARKRSQDEESFVIGHDEELAYLHTMIDERQGQGPHPNATGAQGPTSSWLPYPSTTTATLNKNKSAVGQAPLPAPSAQPPSNNDKRLSAGMTVGNLMLNAHDMATPAEPPKVSPRNIPSCTQNTDSIFLQRTPVKYLSNASNVPASSFLKPTTFIPMTQINHPHPQPQTQTQAKHQSNYRSPTESLYGCYKDREDDDRQASFISTLSTSGSASGGGNVPAVPPIPVEYRK